MNASTIVLVLVSPMNLILNWLFISKLDYGFRGAALGTMISYWIAFLLICRQ